VGRLRGAARPGHVCAGVRTAHGPSPRRVDSDAAAAEATRRDGCGLGGARGRSDASLSLLPLRKLSARLDPTANARVSLDRCGPAHNLVQTNELHAEQATPPWDAGRRTSAQPGWTSPDRDRGRLDRCGEPPRPRGVSSVCGERCRIVSSPSCAWPARPIGPLPTRSWPRSCPTSAAAFGVPAADPVPAWRPWPDGLDPDRVFAFKYRLKVAKDDTIRASGQPIQLPAAPRRFAYAGKMVEVHLRLDGSVAVFDGERELVTAKAPPDARDLRPLDSNRLSHRWCPQPPVSHTPHRSSIHGREPCPSRESPGPDRFTEQLN